MNDSTLTSQMSCKYYVTRPMCVWRTKKNYAFNSYINIVRFRYFVYIKSDFQLFIKIVFDLLLYMYEMIKYINHCLGGGKPDFISKKSVPLGFETVFL